jgi:hypothetical protein
MHCLSKQFWDNFLKKRTTFLFDRQVINEWI